MMLDVFNNDAFSVTSLTDFINEIKYRPGRIGELGLFDRSAVTTTSIAIERIGDTIQLVAPSPRGAPGETRTTPKRSVLSLQIPHFQRDWSVMADEVQGVRGMGEEQAVMTVQQLVDQKLADNQADLAVTEEAIRLSAITGIVEYADGTTLNLYTAFDRTAPTEVDFDLDNATPADGALRKKCTDVIRAMRSALGATPFQGVHSFCSDNFFDDLLRHKEVRDTYKGHSEAAILRDSYVGPNRGSNPIFQFGGITFENYGEVGSNGVGVATNKCRFFPLGVTGLFRTYDGPADYIDEVNTAPGQQFHSRQRPMENDKGIKGETQMNCLNICTRPDVLMSAKRT